MKTLILTCLFGLTLGLATGFAQETNKAGTNATPDFTDPSKLKEKAPETFKVRFDTTKGAFTVEVTRSLRQTAPTASTTWSSPVFRTSPASRVITVSCSSSAIR